MAAGVRGCTRGGGDCIRVNGTILSCGSTRGSGCTRDSVCLRVDGCAHSGMVVT